MTDKKISALTDLGGAPASTDVLPIVDSSANQTKKVSVESLFTNQDVTGTLTADKVGIGTTSPSSYDSNADNLVIGGESAVGLTLASSATTGRGSIYFADGTSGDQKYRGTVNYFHNGDYLTITTAATERMRIDSSGNVGIGTSSPAAKLEIGGAGEGIILASPDGTRYEITVANGGTLTVTAV